MELAKSGCKAFKGVLIFKDTGIVCGRYFGGCCWAIFSDIAVFVIAIRLFVCLVGVPFGETALQENHGVP